MDKQKIKFRYFGIEFEIAYNMKNNINTDYLYNIAEANVSYSIKVKNSDRQKLKSSGDATKFFRALLEPYIKTNEAFYCMYLNNQNQVLAVSRISEGGITSTVVDQRIILRTALFVGAVGLILSHNHPSGNTQPSESDIALTHKINKAASLLDLKLLDHIIITEDSSFSFADNNII